MENSGIEIRVTATAKHVLLWIINGAQITTFIWCSLYYDQDKCYISRPRDEFNGQSSPNNMDLFADNLTNNIQGSIFTISPLKISFDKDQISIRQGMASAEFTATDELRRQFAKVVRWFAHFRRTTPIVTRGGMIIKPEKGG